MTKLLSFLIVAILLLSDGYAYAQNERPVWSIQKAKEWYAGKNWICGADFIPSTAINQLEMWQSATFDPITIDRELGYAQSIGFNTMRVYLHHLAWQEDSAGFIARIRKYLDIADRHRIKTIFVLFDDCWNDIYHPGKQPEPKPGIHNSGWVRDPGSLYFNEPLLADTLQQYVKDVLSTFGNDDRILLWDLYNEPGNSNYGMKSMKLLKNVFSWAREINPVQPLSAGVWNPKLTGLNAFQLANSDIITYHNYNDEKEHQKVIDSLRKYGRPLICTEYMARTRGSLFFNIMPLLKKEHVGAINWGLVAGKTNTKYAWDTPIPDGKEPVTWFHDVFRPDGTPYDNKEINLIKSLTGAK